MSPVTQLIAGVHFCADSESILGQTHSERCSSCVDSTTADLFESNKTLTWPPVATATHVIAQIHGQSAFTISRVCGIP